MKKFPEETEEEEEGAEEANLLLLCLPIPSQAGGEAGTVRKYSD